MHSGNDGKFLSPAQMGRVDNNLRRSFTPMMLKKISTPDISPILKPSPCLNRRRDKIHRQINFLEENPNENPNLEKSLSVHTILVDLKLIKYEKIFNQEEINLSVFFTLDKDDLKSIGIKNILDIKKIIAFIEDVATAKKSQTETPSIKTLYR